MSFVYWRYPGGLYLEHNNVDRALDRATWRDLSTVGYFMIWAMIMLIENHELRNS